MQDCDCKFKQHFVCRKTLKKEENLFFTKSNLGGIETVEDDNIDPMTFNTGIKIANLLLNINSSSFKTTKTNNNNLDVPIAEPLKSNNNDENTVLNAEELENDLLKLATYLLSPSFTDKYYNDTSFVDNNFEDDETSKNTNQELRFLKENKINSKDNLAIKKLVNQTLNQKSILLNNKEQREIVLAKIQILKETNAFETNCPNGEGYYSNNDPEFKQFIKCENFDQKFYQITLFKCFDDYKFDLNKLKCI